MGMQSRSLLMATVAVSMTACGGGEDSAPPATREISKASLIEKADVMCRRDQERLSAKLQALPKLPEGSTTRAARVRLIAPVLEANAQTILSGARRIAALGRPTTDAALFDEFLNARRTAGNALQRAAEAARANDPADLREASELFNNNEAQALGIRFGFKACGLGLNSAPTPAER